MTFKIVQTVENGRKLLTIVPHHWEQMGTLFWPRKSTVNAQDDSDSNKPDDKAHKYRCIVKRQNLQTYDEAENILDVMQQQSDSDDKSKDLSQTKTVQIKIGSKTVKSSSQMPDLETIIDPTDDAMIKKSVCIF